MRRFLDCSRGNFTVAFAIAVLPVLGAAGVAVDYSRALNIHSYMQVQADAAALAAARVGYEGADTRHIEYLKAATAQRFGSGSVSGLTVDADWLTPVDYRITVRANMPVTVLSAVPGFDDNVPLSVTATARIAEPRYVYEAPEVSELDNEAGDYNRVYVYCFDPEVEAAAANPPAVVDDDDDNDGRGRGNDRERDDDRGRDGDRGHNDDRGRDRDRGHNDGRGRDGDRDRGDNDSDDDDPVVASSSNAARTQMTAIADNAGTRYDFEMPRCDAGQTLSFRLLNVRLAREDRSKWDDPDALHFDYYTDTVVDGGTDKHDLDGWSVLETALCNNLRECDKRSNGGIVPEGRDRVPSQARSTCTPGKYMYYGWEDRPPGMDGPDDDWTDVAWTDRDYDDIRIVMKCPSLEAEEERMVRLVK